MTAAATYIARPNIVIDTYFGYTRAQADSRQADLNQNIGLNILQIPGTNGTRWFKGGWPQITISNFAAIGAPNNYEPNLLNDPEYEENFNVCWTHSFRFDASVLKQDLNDLQAQPFGGAAYGAQAGFGFAVGETSSPGAKTSQFNSFVSFLLRAVDSAAFFRRVNAK